MSTGEFQIAPHLERALEAMSKDLAIEPQALVNQAVFAWLRINGYVAPSAAVAAAAHEAAHAPTAERPVPVPAPLPATGSMKAFVPSTPAAEPEAPAPAKKKSEPMLSPVAEPPPAPPKKKSEPMLAPVAEPPPPAAEVAPVVVPPEPEAPQVAPPTSSPSGGQLAAMARMKEIAADLEKLTRPWPDWVAKEELEEEEEEEEQDDEGDERDEADADEPEDDSDSDSEDEADSGTADEEQGAPAEARDPFEADLPSELNTGESDVGEDEPPPEDEPPADSTVVLRSVPIVLYLEREGADPVRVDTERFIIGRGPSCDLVIDSPRVSREHVALTRSGIRYFIEDLNSSNGTWFGEERISKRELESGDVISLGNEPVTFILRGE